MTTYRHTDIHTNTNNERAKERYIYIYIYIYLFIYLFIYTDKAKQIINTTTNINNHKATYNDIIKQWKRINK